MYLVFDTETTGIPKDRKAPASDVANWPRVVQLGWEIFDSREQRTGNEAYIVRPDGFRIPKDAEDIHGISTEKARRDGRVLADVLESFSGAVREARVIVAHNLDFDENVVSAELHRIGRPLRFHLKERVCTMKAATDICKIPGPYGYKWPTLPELYQFLFKKQLKEAHDAAADVSACAKCFFELKRRGVIRIERGQPA